MKSHFLTLSFVLLFSVPASSFAQSLKDAKQVFQSGNWKVLRSIDPMQDTTVCTGIYNENYSIQLTASSLFLSIQGGIRSVTLRFDDEPVRNLRLATEMEKNIRSVIISGSDFVELNGSKRLRYQVSTLVSGIQTNELDLTGFPEALSNIRSKCPLQVETAARTSMPSGTLCTTTLVDRMRNQGIKDDQITSICR